MEDKLAKLVKGRISLLQEHRLKAKAHEEKHCAENTKTIDWINATWLDHPENQKSLFDEMFYTMVKLKFEAAPRLLFMVDTSLSFQGEGLHINDWRWFGKAFYGVFEKLFPGSVVYVEEIEEYESKWLHDKGAKCSPSKNTIAIEIPKWRSSDELSAMVEAYDKKCKDLSEKHLRKKRVVNHVCENIGDYVNLLLTQVGTYRRTDFQVPTEGLYVIRDQSIKDEYIDDPELLDQIYNKLGFYRVGSKECISQCVRFDVDVWEHRGVGV